MSCELYDWWPLPAPFAGEGAMGKKRKDSDSDDKKKKKKKDKVLAARDDA